jgi:hypothetical protein
VIRVTGNLAEGQTPTLEVVLDLDVANDVTRGLLGIALHPDFSGNGFVYLFYSRSDTDGGAWLGNRVERFVWNGANLDPTSATAIVVFPADDDQNNTPACEGGLIRFGPDGKLWGTIGDLGRGDFANPRIEQNTGAGASSHGGGIFRLNDDGSIPVDNPFAAHEIEDVRRLFAYGVRNSFGFDWDADTGELWDAENGPEVYDEINCVRAGMNSGWLKLMGPDARDAEFEKNEHVAHDATDLLEIDGAHYADPAVSFLDPIGVTSLTFIAGARFPCDLQGRLLLGDNNFGLLYLFELNATRDGLVLDGGLADGVADNDGERDALRVGQGWGITTALAFGPDGWLYHLSLLDGALRRVGVSGATGDLNGDGSVQLDDLQTLLLAFGIDAGGDLDCDGDTDIGDLGRLLANFGR